MRGVKGHGERLKSTEEELLLYKFISIVPREEGGSLQESQGESTVFDRLA